jgi:sugar transferase (PEP-CTERM/EpsH1 system associated)
VPPPSRRPRIVFLCQRVPWPPDRGDRITTWHFLQHFLERGARVQVGAFQEEERDADGVAFLRQRGCEVSAPFRPRRRGRRIASLRGLVTGEALTLPFFRDRTLAAAVRAWLDPEPPDLVWVYSSSMAQYVLAVPPAARPRATVMQFAELDSDKWRQYAAVRRGYGRWLYAREARLLLAFEDRVARTFARSLVVSDVERTLFRERIPGVDPAVLPNGVDVGHFTSRGDDARHPHTAVFTGVMDYEPNVDGVTWFASWCWPELRRRFPDARLTIVGSKPVPKVQQLAQLPGVTVTGRVPETPPWFDRAAVAIAPLRLARGVQNKVLEAMSMGLPVVSSPQAAQGLGDVPPGTIAVADGADATVTAVARLFADPAGARAVGAAAAAWVRREWPWSRMYERADALLGELGVTLPG